MSREFEGKTIFITGAAKGPGRAVDHPMRISKSSRAMWKTLEERS